MLLAGEIMAKYYYPAIFFPDGESFGVIVPDLDGCFSQGDNLNAAMFWAVDAIGTWLVGTAEKDFPRPSKPNEIDASAYPNAVVNVVEFDTAKWEAAFNPIRRARENAGLSIKELADLLGAPYRTVQDWNSGKRKPPLWLQKLVVEKIQNNL